VARSSCEIDLCVLPLPKLPNVATQRYQDKGATHILRVGGQNARAEVYGQNKLSDINFAFSILSRDIAGGLHKAGEV